MENNKILTIAIPTFNRATLLEKLLQDLAVVNRQIVDVIICDNCSVDNTQQIVGNHLLAFPHDRYYRNSVNAGPDNNFLLCLENSNSKYVLILSDDDNLDLPNLNELIGFLSSNDVDIIHLNTKGSISKKKNYNVDKVKFFSHSEVFSFFLQTGIMLTLISSIIFNKISFNKIVNKKQFLGSYLIQLDFIHSILSLDKSTSAIFPFFSITALENNSGGYNFFEVFIKSIHNITFNSKNKFLNYFQRRRLYSSYLIFVFNWTKRIRILNQKFLFNLKFSHFLILITYPLIGFKILFLITLDLFKSKSSI